MPLALQARRSLMPCSAISECTTISRRSGVRAFGRRRPSRRLHQRQVRLPALEPSVLVLQFAQLRQVCNRHARVLAFPFVIGRLTHAMLSARLADLGAQLDLLEDGNDLGFTESGFLHVETPLVGILYSQLAQVSEGDSKTP